MVEATTDMTKVADEVYLISRSAPRADSLLLDKLRRADNLSLLMNNFVLAVEGSSMVESIRTRDTATGMEQVLDVAGVFAEIGLMPNSDLTKGITRLNQAGEIEVNCTCETEVPELFATVDVTNIPDKRIVAAAGEGAKAALQDQRYLRTIL